MDAKKTMFDSMGLFQHHDAITGTDAHFVDADYQYRLLRSTEKSNVEYQKQLLSEFTRQTGLKANDLTPCLGN